MTPNDASVIQGLIDRVAQKPTPAVSLRLPVEDLEAAAAAPSLKGKAGRQPFLLKL